MQLWKVTYDYVNPGRGGPFRGKDVIKSDTKPLKGDTFPAMFGRAVIKTSSKVKVVPA